MTRKSDQGKACPPNGGPGAREAENDIPQQTHTPENNTQGLGEQMHSSNEATQRCPQRHASPTSKYQFFERHVRSRCIKLGGETDSAIRRRKRTGVTSQRGREGS